MYRNIFLKRFYKVFGTGRFPYIGEVLLSRSSLLVLIQSLFLSTEKYFTLIDVIKIKKWKSRRLFIIKYTHRVFLTNSVVNILIILPVIISNIVWGNLNLNILNQLLAFKFTLIFPRGGLATIVCIFVLLLLNKTGKQHYISYMLLLNILNKKLAQHLLILKKLKITYILSLLIQMVFVGGFLK